MKNLWYCYLSTGNYDLINRISPYTQLLKTVWSLKQALPLPPSICQNLTAVWGWLWTPFGSWPRWEREPSEELSSKWNGGRETQAWGVMTGGKTTHLPISVCCLSPLKNPHRTGCTQVKEEVQIERILTSGVSRVSDIQHCAELDSSAWQPGELASGDMCIFFKLCVFQNFFILFLLTSLHFRSFFFNLRNFLDLSFSSVRLHSSTNSLARAFSNSIL